MEGDWGKVKKLEVKSEKGRVQKGEVRSERGIMSRKSLRVGVLMGGSSAEREISLKTGEAICEVLASSSTHCCSY